VAVHVIIMQVADNRAIAQGLVNPACPTPPPPPLVSHIGYMTKANFLQWAKNNQWQRVTAVAEWSRLWSSSSRMGTQWADDTTEEQNAVPCEIRFL
jgi:hypothetical protein